MSEKRKDIRKTISPIIGTKLKEFRISRELTLEELADKIEISKSMIYYIESAKRLPSVRVIRLYSRFFKVDELELLDLREQTIFETVAMLGDEAPLAIRNERKMLAHSYEREERFRGVGHPLDLMRPQKTLRDAIFRNQRAEERAKIERSIYEIDDIEVTDEELQIAIEAVRAFRRQNDSSFE